MRRFSTSLRALAIFGVLLHAGLIVWHSAAMVGATMQHNAIVAAIASICHGAGPATGGTQDDLPSVPAPSNEQSSCPICKGCVSAVAILSDPGLVVHRADPATARMEIVGEVIAQRVKPVRPPTRAPPVLA